jgi:hypothetical protein
VENLAFSRIAELEAKLDILQTRFDKLRVVVTGEGDRLEAWAVEDRARRDTKIDDWDIREARENLKAALLI